MNFPPNFPPGVGGPTASSAAPTMQAQIVPRDKVQRALYQAASIIAQAHSELTGALAMLSETHMMCKQTAKYRESDNLVNVGGQHMGIDRFAEQFELARQEDADAVEQAISLIQDALERFPASAISELADRTPKRIQ